MELLTFSAVLSFAISMEEKAEGFYRKAAEHGECGSMSEMFSALARKNESPSFACSGNKAGERDGDGA